MDVDTRNWTEDEIALWQRLEAHPFEDANGALDFTRRLARTMDWSLDETRAGITEYRRFCFLAVVSPTPVTPSEEIDEIWHLHLTYTRDYWTRWCTQVLGKSLHHEPTTGGADEYDKFRRQYAETLALYETYFGAPDAVFWPGFARRFRSSARYRLVDIDRMAVVRRPALARRLARVPGIGLLVALTGCTPETSGAFDILDWTGPDFLRLYIPSLVAAFVVGALIRWALAQTGAGTLDRDPPPIEIAYLKGGLVRAADTLVLELATRGAAETQTDGVRILDEAARLPSSFEPFRSLPPGPYTRSALVRTMKNSTAADRLVMGLSRRNLVRDPGSVVTARLLTLLPVALVLAVGLAKFAVGLSRGKPIGFLVFSFMIAAFALAKLLSGPWRTAAGSAALSDIRSRLDRAARAPRAGEIPIAYALIGTAALTGTSYAVYARSISSGGDGGSGCGGGGGGGGGGCGGCGG